MNFVFKKIPSFLPFYSTSKVGETNRHTRDILEAIMEKNRSGRAGKKIKTLIIVKGNLKKVNFVTFHIIVCD